MEIVAYNNVVMDRSGYNIPVPPPPAIPVAQPFHSCILIPSILNEILSYSSYSDLKQHRQVCKQWNEEARKHLRKKICVEFDQNKRITTYHQEMEGSKDFCEHFRVTVQGLSPALGEFLQDFGFWVRKLELTCQIGLPRSDLLCILYDLVPNLEELYLGIVDLFKLTHGLFPNHREDEFIQILPKMKKLNLNFEMMEEGEPKELIRDLIRVMPNLEEISIPKLNYSQLNISDIVYISNQHMVAGKEDCIEDFLEILEPHPTWLLDIVETFFKNAENHLSKLKCINIPLRLNNEQIRRLGNQELPLECLNLELNPKVKSSCVDKLLYSLRRTVKHLQIKYIQAIKSKRDIYFTKCNQFEKLTSVHLLSYHGSINFLKSIPQLKNLTLSRIYFSRSVLLENLDIKNPHGLRCLKVYDDMGSQCAPSAVAKITKYLPNLAKLRLEKLTDQGLNLIFNNCPVIEELEIVKGLFSDQGITGIHPNAYRVFLRENSFDNIRPEVYRQGPYIGALTRLRTLDIAAARITDVSFILGVMCCQNLRHLQVSCYGLTDSSLYRLVDKMDLISLKTELCNQLTTPAVQYAKMKLFGREVRLNEYKGPIDRKRIPSFIRENRNLRVSLPCL